MYCGNVTVSYALSCTIASGSKKATSTRLNASQLELRNICSSRTIGPKDRKHVGSVDDDRRMWRSDGSHATFPDPNPSEREGIACRPRFATTSFHRRQPINARTALCTRDARGECVSSVDTIRHDGGFFISRPYLRQRAGDVGSMQKLRRM